MMELRQGKGKKNDAGNRKGNWRSRIVHSSVCGYFECDRCSGLRDFRYGRSKVVSILWVRSGMVVGRVAGVFELLIRVRDLMLGEGGSDVRTGTEVTVHS